MAIILCGHALAQRAVEVSLRFSRQETAVRVVFESDEDTIRKAFFTANPASVRIDFPTRVELKMQNDFPFELVRRDKAVVMNLRDVTDVRAYRLTAPSRIVIDIKTSVKTQKEPLKPEQKPGQPQAIQPGQKPLQPPVAQQPAAAAPKGPPGQKPQEPSPAKAAEQPLTADKGKKVKIVMIDAGHGGYDSGIVGGDAKEKDVNLSLAKDLYTVLVKKGYTVYMTRKVDQPSSLTERINFAGSKNQEVFISIHASSSERFAVYTATGDEQGADAVKLYSTVSRQNRHLARSRNLAKVLANSLRADFGSDVAQRELPLPILSTMNATAVMIDYPSVRAYASDVKLREKFISSVMKGIAGHEQ